MNPDARLIPTLWDNYEAWDCQFCGRHNAPGGGTNNHRVFVLGSTDTTSDVPRVAICPDCLDDLYYLSRKILEARKA